MEEESVFKYLGENPDLVEKYITSTLVSQDQFDRWALIRRKSSARSKSSSSRSSWSSSDLTSRRRIILDQADEQVSLNTTTLYHNEARMIFELAQCCAHVLDVSAVEAVLLNDDGAFRIVKDDDGSLRLEKKGKKTSLYCQKVIGPLENTLGEIHFNREISENDRQIVNVICTWAAAAMHFAQMASHLSDGENGTFEVLAKERRLSNFLLDVTKSFFQDIVSMDTVIIKIMNFAQSLVNADRASLFLVDQKSQELYARIFDVGTGDEEHAKIREDGKKEIRFSMSKGIAGHVATTGLGLNIENAYDDERFNKDVDSTTGYTTKSILCMPILIRNQ